MANYIEPLITCDKILGLFTPERTAGYSHNDFLVSLGIGHRTPEAGYVLAAISRLTEDKHIELYGNTNSLYKITGNTFQFKNAGGYEGLIKRENEINAANTVAEKVALQSAQFVIATNLSIQSLNENTSTFYTNQTSFNTWQKVLTIAILASSITYTVITYFILKAEGGQSKPETSIVQPTIQQLKSQILQDSIFLKNLRDSLIKH